MDAQTYLETHWLKKQVWKNLALPKHQDRLKRCADFVGGAGETFIDVGCGLGHSTDIMSGFHPGHWAGLEFFAPAIGTARQLFPAIEFYAAQDFNLRAVCGEFDGVVCSEVIEHVADDAGLVRGLLEITRKTLVLTTPNRFVNDPGHLRIYDRPGLLRLFQGNSVEVESIGRFFYIIVQADKRRAFEEKKQGIGSAAPAKAPASREDADRSGAGSEGPRL